MPKQHNVDTDEVNKILREYDEADTEEEKTGLMSRLFDALFGGNKNEGEETNNES